MNAERVLEHLHNRLPRFEVGGWPERVGAGLNGSVWRVPGRPVPVVVKHATSPAASPEQLEQADGQRLCFEARMLENLGPDGDLTFVSTPEVRPPHLLDFDEDDRVLVLEDVGRHPDLAGWLHEGRPSEQVGRQIGRFIGLLHAHTRGGVRLGDCVAGHTLPQERYDALYAPVADLAHRAGAKHAARIGAKAAALGKRFAQEGRCVVVGDLRPAAIRVTPQGLRVADWSKAYVGSPAEDVGTLAAHLWMHIHRAPNIPAAVQASLALRNFIDTYADTVAEVSGTRLDGTLVDDCAIRFGIEVFTRTVGADQDRALYDRLPPDSPIIQDVVGIAARHIQHPEDVDMFRSLRG